jgi:hypothetical protein
MNVQFSLRFLGIILRVLRLEVSVCNVCITKKFQTTFVRGGGGDPSAEMTVNSNGEHSKTLVPITSKNPASGLHDAAFVKTARRSNHSSRCILYNS